MDDIRAVYWYTKGTAVGRKLRHKQQQKIEYLEQLLQDIVVSSGPDRDELLNEAAYYLKDRRK